MKVLWQQGHGAMNFIYRGFLNAFAACGHSVMFWDAEKKPALDVFSEFEPDIFIGATYQVDRSILKAVKARPSLHVALRASNYGPLNDEIDLEKYPVLVATSKEKKMVEQLKPKFVFSHYPERYIDETLGGWRNVGTEPISMPSAYDNFLYDGGQFDLDLACDIGYTGGYWPYKARNLNRYILPLCYPAGKYNIKIFGNGWGGLGQYLGTIQEHKIRDLFKSAKIVPAVHESHSNIWGFDVVERVYKSAGVGGGLTISDYVEGIEDLYTPDQVVMADSPEEYEEEIQYYLENEEKRLEIVKNAREQTIDNHLYLHRISDMFWEFGLLDEAEQAGRRIEEIYKRTAGSSNPT